MTDFHATEWNALVNRAGAMLRALGAGWPHWQCRPRTDPGRVRR